MFRIQPIGVHSMIRIVKNNIRRQQLPIAKVPMDEPTQRKPFPASFKPGEMYVMGAKTGRHNHGIAIDVLLNPWNHYPAK